ncbi:MAG: aminodeoxychorismate synthase component I, partial [Gammaproteobacteria bacterium]
MKIKLTELPYQRDSSALFSAIANEPWCVFLDSGYPSIDSGRYDILSCRPYITLQTSDGETVIKDTSGVEEHSAEDPFYLLLRFLGPKRENRTGLPFC